MASTKVRGITIELGADTSGINTALKTVNKEIGDTQKSLKDVNKLLKLDPTNTKLLEQRQRLLATAVQDTNKKLSVLKKTQEEVGRELKETGKGQEQYDALTREIASCERELRELEKAASQSNVTLSKVKATADKVATTAANVGRAMAPVTAGLTLIGTASVSAASDLAEAQNKVEVAFGQSSDYVKQFADSTLEAYGIARGSALDMSALFGDMATSMGLSQAEAAKMSMSLVGLAGDLASFKNIGLEQATTALKGIFTGETESLKTLGVVMTQTNLDAYALANGFGKTTKEMTEAEKVQLRYQYILNATANAQGDFANTSEGTANSIRIFQESVKELEEELGEVLLPIITPIIQKLTELVQSFSNLSPEAQEAIVYIGLFVAAISPVAFAVSGIAKAVSGVTTVLGTLGSAFGTAATTVSAASGTAAAATTAATTTVTGALAATATTVAAVLGGIVIGLTGQVAIWAYFGEGVKGTLNKLDKYLQNVFQKDWTKTFGALGETMNAFMKSAKDVWDNIKKTGESFITACQHAWSSDWQAVWTDIKNVFSSGWQAVVAIGKAPINAIIGMVNSAISGINSVISSVNRLSFKLPNWLGGKSWSPNFSTIGSMPYLASGGVVTQGSAIVGEAGAELLTVSNGQARVQPLTNSTGEGHSDITSLLEAYLPYLANNDSIVLDTGVLVGQIAPQMSNALGRIYTREIARR